MTAAVGQDNVRAEIAKQDQPGQQQHCQYSELTVLCVCFVLKWYIEGNEFVRIENEWILGSQGCLSV